MTNRIKGFWNRMTGAEKFGARVTLGCAGGSIFFYAGCANFIGIIERSSSKDEIQAAWGGFHVFAGAGGALLIVTIACLVSTIVMVVRRTRMT